MSRILVQICNQAVGLLDAHLTSVLDTMGNFCISVICHVMACHHLHKVKEEHSRFRVKMPKASLYIIVRERETWSWVPKFICDSDSRPNKNNKKTLDSDDSDSDSITDSDKNTWQETLAVQTLCRVAFLHNLGNLAQVLVLLEPHTLGSSGLAWRDDEWRNSAAAILVPRYWWYSKILRYSKF